MRIPWVPLAALAVLLMLCLPATGALGEGGIDPGVPSDLYKENVFHPFVDFSNVSIPLDGKSTLDLFVSYKGDPKYEQEFVAGLTLEIYGWGKYGKEEPLSGDLPKFQYFDEDQNMTVETLVYSTTLTVPENSNPQPITPDVVVPAATKIGFYRVSVLMEWKDDSGTNVTAQSMGIYTPGEWDESIDRVDDTQKPIDADYLISEAGFTVVPRDFEKVRLPNKVPDFGNFTTPVIRPGESGKYNFTVTNRYSIEITNVTVTVEFYMWATIEDAKPIEDIEGPPPKVKGEGAPRFTKEFNSITSKAFVPIDLTITTSGDTDKGTYFVRHMIEFTYLGERFIMSSRGYFTWDQWEGFDYSNLWYQLDGNAGIVPDSSFSVKDPVPLWPLATLIALCVLFGALAVVFYLAEEHGDQYPRLKKGLQTITGRWEQRKRLMQQRMDELRGEDWEAGDEDVDEAEGITEEK